MRVNRGDCEWRARHRDTVGRCAKQQKRLDEQDRGNRSVFLARELTRASVRLTVVRTTDSPTVEISRRWTDLI